MKTLLAVLTLIATWATAEPRSESRDWNAYIGEGTSNIDMKSRAYEAVNAYTEQIEMRIAELLAQMDDEADALLRKDQAAWTLWSEAHARMLSDTYRGGSHRGLSYLMELKTLHALRLQQLSKLPHNGNP